MTKVPPDWARAMRALTCLAIDPGGLKGMVVRARAGPVRQTLEQALPRLPLPLRRIHPTITDSQLFGGLNVAASLSEGHMVQDKGLADAPATLVLPMAERCPTGLAARLGQLLDADAGHALILLDEGVEAEEQAPTPLRERLAFSVELGEMRHNEAVLRLPAPGDLDAASAALSTVQPTPEDISTLTALAARFGISSLRAPQLALRAACALAALEGETELSEAHLREAAELVYPSRATMIPEDLEDDSDHAPEPEPDEGQAEDQGEDETDGFDIPDEMLIAAVAALLPPDFLDRLAGQTRRARGLQGSGAGSKRLANRRGRPLPSRPGRIDGRARVDVVATLRAAAPWQPIRRKAREGADAPAPRLIIHPSDIRLKRYEERSDRLVIFTVDASGSSAMARMAEAKGAVELMLASAYAKRDQVALIAFRGEIAEALLSPTRSLVQAKRQLAGLPGGGGTPLAAGLKAALEMAALGRVRGLTPTLAVLTDGRANVGLGGAKGRAKAREDAQIMARHVAHLNLPSVVIDTAARPGPEGAALAGWLGAEYLALPRADADRISAAADAALTA